MTEATTPTSRSQRLITLIIILGFIIGLALVAWFGLDQIEKQYRVQVRNSLHSVLRSTHETMYVWLDNRLKVLKSIGQNEELINLIEAQLAVSRDVDSLRNSDKLIALREFFGPVMREYGDLGMFIIAPDFTSIASMRNSNIGSLNIIAQKKPQLLKRVFAGEAHFIPPISSAVLLKDKTGRLVKNQPTMFIATPVRNQNNEVIAVLTLRLDPKNDFTNITQLGRIGETGETYALDETGVLISESRFDDQLRNVGHLGPNQQTILNIRVSDPGVDLTQGFKPNILPEQQPLTLMAEQATKGFAGFNIEGYRDYRGIEVFGSWLWDEKLGFAMATEIDASEALQPFHATRMVVLTTFLFALILVAMLLGLLGFVSKNNKRNLQILYRQLEQRVRERTVALEDAKVKLSIANRELQELATVDSLTGLANRRHLDDFLNKEWHRCMRDQQAISFVLFDIDYFKLYNDHYGHLAGDDCLQEIGNLLKSERFLSRPGDLIARYGGEEFAIVLSGTCQDDAVFIMNKLMKTLHRAAFPHEGTLITNCSQITISAGVASLVPCKEMKPSHLIDLADEALYRAKSKGRNQFQLAQNRVEEEAS